MLSKNNKILRKSNKMRKHCCQNLPKKLRKWKFFRPDQATSSVEIHCVVSAQCPINSRRGFRSTAASIRFKPATSRFPRKAGEVGGGGSRTATEASLFYRTSRPVQSCGLFHLHRTSVDLLRTSTKPHPLDHEFRELGGKMFHAWTAAVASLTETKLIYLLILFQKSYRLGMLIRVTLHCKKTRWNTRK